MTLGGRGLLGVASDLCGTCQMSASHQVVVGPATVGCAAAVNAPNDSSARARDFARGSAGLVATGCGGHGMRQVIATGRPYGRRHSRDEVVRHRDASRPHACWATLTLTLSAWEAIGSGSATAVWKWEGEARATDVRGE